MSDKRKAIWRIVKAVEGKEQEFWVCEKHKATVCALHGRILECERVSSDNVDCDLCEG